MFSARSLDGNRTLRWSLSAIMALGAHAALALGAFAMPAPQPAAVEVTEIELVPPKAPEPAPSAPAPEPEKTDEPSQRESASAPRPADNRAPVARAGNVITAKSDAPTPAGSDPVDFVTDPNGSTYGSGIVARGGTADHGSGGPTPRAASPAVSSTPAARPAAKSDIVPASDLSRAPVLSTGTNCAGYYPRSADADSALVTLVVVVAPDGGIASLSVAGESPAGQGFGAAARACIGTGRFRPALDKTGRAVKSATRVRVTFTR
jgi:translation initiation factor IF-2